MSAIAEINKLEQQQNELFTRQGRTLQKEKNREFLRGIVDTLRLVRDIALGPVNGAGSGTLTASRNQVRVLRASRSADLP